MTKDIWPIDLIGPIFGGDLLDRDGDSIGADPGDRHYVLRDRFGQWRFCCSERPGMHFDEHMRPCDCLCLLTWLRLAG